MVGRMRGPRAIPGWRSKRGGRSPELQTSPVPLPARASTYAQPSEARVWGNDVTDGTEKVAAVFVCIVSRTTPDRKCDVVTHHVGLFSISVLMRASVLLMIWPV